MEKVSQIEEKVKNLKEELKRQHSNLAELRSGIEKTVSNISAIEGALQAYLESIRILNEPEHELRQVSEK